MKIIKATFTTLFFTCFALASTVLSQEDEKTNISVEELREKIFILSFNNNNSILFTGSDANIIFTKNYNTFSPKVLEKTKEINDKPLKFIVFSHIDNENLDYKNLNNVINTSILFQENALKRLSEQTKTGFTYITFNSNLTLKFGEEEINLVYYPFAYSDADTVVYFKNSNLLYTGNIFYPASFPLINVEAGGTVKGYLDAVNRLVKISDKKTVLIPGTGTLSNKKRLKEYQKMFKNSKNRIELMINADKDLRDVLNEKPLEDFSEKWDSESVNSQDFTKNLYEALSN